MSLFFFAQAQDALSWPSFQEFSLENSQELSLSRPSWQSEKEWSFSEICAKPVDNDSMASMDKSKLSFKEKNSGAFRSKKKGGHRSPGIAALCSSLVPGLGQFYNGQWYKPPVIYGGAAVIAYFIATNYQQKRVYEKEIDVRFRKDTSAFNSGLAGYSYENLLELRNYYEQNFELTIIIAGALYILNIVDAVVYAHLFDFSVSPNLSMRIEPYAVPNFSVSNTKFPMDVGFRICLTLK